MHLGMSGSISVVPSGAILKKHQHFEIELDNKTKIFLHDPRRFGAVLWQKENETLKLIRNLGPEPLNDGFSGDTLYKLSRGKKQNIKTFIMDNNNVVGVGNIYASESLFVAGISPKRASGNVSKKRYQKLTRSITDVLTRAIEKGGTTLNDFTAVDGQPGHFSQALAVYNRKDMPCKRCDGTIKRIIQNQRASYYCPKCQT
jgi:formamidopyrimidine-DNA glycosylase